jgi:hypothetical protein
VAALAAGGVLTLTGAAPLPNREEKAHLEWVAQCYQTIRSVKTGQTRRDVLKAFKRAGGRQSRQLTTYLLARCPYFKISVQFEPADDKAEWSPNDKVVKVGTPYLEDPNAE